MITITKTKQKLEVSGHAGFAEQGKDIVCEAVTSQVQTLLYSIRQLANDHPDEKLCRGYFSMELNNLSEKSIFLVSSFIVGMRLLQDGYPENVMVIEE